MTRKRPDPELIDDENPEWTAEDSANAQTAAEALPKLFGEHQARAMLRPRGRPTAESTKERITIRLSPEVVQTFRATGPGWQTRIDAALREWLRTHKAMA